MSSPSFVFQPGIGNSEPTHWQSIWARELSRSIWVEQRDWDHPVRDEWIGALLDQVRRAEGRKVLVAHSLGCLAVAEAAGALAEGSVAGAFLVSVPDVSGPDFPKSAVGFAPALSLSLPFPSLVVASSDDPYGSLEHAEEVARRWRSRFVCVGARGHINARSSLGRWAEGRALLDDFVASL